jgi:hypothetical protein
MAEPNADPGEVFEGEEAQERFEILLRAMGRQPPRNDRERAILADIAKRNAR